MIKLLVKRNIKKAIKEVFNNCFELKCLLDTFKINKYEYAFVGGFVRHFVITKIDYSDIDIIVKIHANELKHIVKHYKFDYDINNLGGIKIHTEKGLDIDIWSFYAHKPFEYMSDKFKDWKYIPRSSKLSLDGVTYTSKNKLYLGDILKSIKTNTVFAYDYPYIDDIIIAKLYYYRSLGFKLENSMAFELSLYMLNHKGKSRASKYLEKYNLNKEFIQEARKMRNK